MPMQTILLIEDDRSVQALVKAIFGSRYNVLLAQTGAEGSALAASSNADLVLLDVSLPDQDGFNLFSQLKTFANLRDVPVIFLTGKSAINDRVAGFSLGADDYIVKPFEPLEFRARVEAKISARVSRINTKEFLKKGRLELDHSMFKAFVRDDLGKRTDLDLTPHEFRLLGHFMTHEGHVISRDQLMTSVWGENVHVLERTIDRHISSLRRKLDPKYEKLESVKGLGYRFSISLNEQNRNLGAVKNG